MHRVKNWAHTSAHKSRFNPWSQDSAVAVATGAPGPEDPNPSGEPEKDKPKVPVSRRIIDTGKKIIFRSWINVLLICVPVGIAVHFAGISPSAVFAINAVAIIPLAGLLTFATESVAHRLGPTLGALMNVSFGNAVELIIFIIALVKNEIRIVQAALIGSILANLLLILGMAFVIGGLQYREQIYDSLVTQMSASLLALAVLSLLIPTAFHYSFDDYDAADAAVLKLSRGTSVILLLMYLLYLAFQLKSHSYLYQGTPQHLIDQQTQPGLAPGLLARFDSTSSTSTASSVTSTTGSGSQKRVRNRLRAKLGRKRHVKSEVQEPVKAEHTPVDDEKAVLDQDEKGKEKAINFVEPSTPPVRSSTDPSAMPNKSKPMLGSPRLSSRPGVDRISEDPNTAASRPKPLLAARGLSFRPPPVFRAASTMQPSPLRPAEQMRRRRTAPYKESNWIDEGGPQFASPPRINSSPTEEESDEPPMSQTASIILLLISTALVALCAEFLVGSIQSIVESSPLSEAFIGLIILPIVGNAAEHVTAVTVAAKNKMDLALGVALGSSIQIALFVTPLVVILGWCMGKEMSLYFNLFETVSIFVSTFVVNFLVLDGRSNYLEGALLCASYVIIAVGAYLFPDSENQSPGTSGPGGTSR